MTMASAALGIAPRTLHVRRAALVLAVRTLGSLPPIFGLARCPTAMWLHHACPGCGMTRAIALLARGEAAASFAMHPLAAPSALAIAMVALATVWSTLTRGSPHTLLDDRFGRAAAVLLVMVNAGALVLWCARALGAMGGLPPV